MGSQAYIDKTKPSISNFSSAGTLNKIIQQATGNIDISLITDLNFMSVATVALGIAPDVLLNAISQVISRTIFSIRPYNRKFAGLFVDNMKWGNHVRKINIGS